MTTISATRSSCQFKKKPKFTSTSSGFVEQQQPPPPEQKTPECDRETEPMKRKKEAKKVSNGGGALLSSEKVVVKYMECRKNHAANIGGYAVDGCREFMPAGEEGTSAGFKCAACTCHRNFHRREAAESECYCDCSSVSATSK